MSLFRSISVIALAGLLSVPFCTLAQDGNTTTAPLTRAQRAELASKERAKDQLREGTTVRMEVVGGDTMPLAQLPAFTYIGERTFKSKKEQKRYTRLMKDVKKVYPYAELAGAKLNEFEDDLAKATTERQRNRYYKRVEKALRNEFGDELTNLSVREGRILIRLIDRETGDTSYELVQELRSGFTAFCFQGVARIFGHNLKSEYNAEEGEDELIEDIIVRIEAGLI